MSDRRLPLAVLLAAVITALTVLPTPAQAANAAPAAGERLPDFDLTWPASPDAAQYLGLPTEPAGARRFAPGQIAGDLLLIEIFSMYCPHCQKEAPVVNRLFQRLQSDGALAGRIKVIGIGVGNSEFEVSHFRQSYAIPFPLFADGDFAIHRRLGEVRTPFFIGLHLRGARAGRIFFTQLGPFPDPDTFLDEFRRLGGLP
jgi:thiol-disulfide isomerase/thioredoxin